MVIEFSLLLRFLCLDALQTQEITMHIEVEENHQFVSVRRKRDPGDLYYIVNGTFGQEGLDMIKKTVRFYDINTKSFLIILVSLCIVNKILCHRCIHH